MPKLTVEFNDQMNNVLAKLAEKKGMTKVDVLRRAVALYNYATENDAMALMIKTKDGETPKEIVLT